MKRIAIGFCILLLACVPAAHRPQPDPKPSSSVAPIVWAPSAIVSPTPPPAIVLPPMHERTLANGLHVLLIEDHTLPIVSLTLRFSAGATDGPVGKTGAAALTAELLREGTTTRNAEQIAEAIDFVGGDLGSSAEPDGISLTAHVLAKDLGLALDLMSDEVRNATFPPSEVDEATRQFLAEIKSRNDDPATMTRVYLEALAYPPSLSYGHAPTERSIRPIRRQDLAVFRSLFLAPDFATLAIAGDVDASEFSDIERAFNGWKPAIELPVPNRPGKILASDSIRRTAPLIVPQIPIRVLDKPELTQSFIALALPGMARETPDFAAVRVLDAIFGSGFGSRLTRVVRTKNGKTYGINAAFEMHKYGGLFVMETSTRSAETSATISLALEEIRAFASGERPATAAELALAKASLIGAYPRRFETADEVAGEILYARALGVPMDELVGMRARIAAVTLEQVNAAATAHLDLSKAVLVVCGNAAEIRAPLEAAIGPVTLVDRLAPLPGEEVGSGR